MPYEINQEFFATWSKPNADYSKLFAAGKCPVCGSYDISENMPKDLVRGGSRMIDPGSMQTDSTSIAHYVCTECGAIWDVKTRCSIEIDIPYSAMWSSKHRDM